VPLGFLRVYGEAESAVGNAASKTKELQLSCEWAASFSRKGKSTLKGWRVGKDKYLFPIPCVSDRERIATPSCGMDRNDTQML